MSRRRLKEGKIKTTIHGMRVAARSFGLDKIQRIARNRLAKRGIANPNLIQLKNEIRIVKNMFAKGGYAAGGAGAGVVGAGAVYAMSNRQQPQAEGFEIGYKNYLFETVDLLSDEMNVALYETLCNQISEMTELESQLLIEEVLYEQEKKRSMYDKVTTKEFPSIIGGGIVSAGLATPAGLVAIGGLTASALVYSIPTMTMADGIALYRSIRASYDKCTRKCGMFAINTLKRQVCMAKCDYLQLKRLYEVSASKNGKKTTQIKQKMLKAKQDYEKYKVFAKQQNVNPNPEFGRSRFFTTPK